jgi:MarR family transcriptional regulator for hemolysin
MVDSERVSDVQHELDAPPWRRFESTLMATSKSIRRAYDLLFAEIGLNLSEACLLEYVVEHGPMSQTQVAERIGMGRAPAGTIVDNLSSRALLRRTPDASDRRVWLLTATDEGIKLAERIVEVDKSLRTIMRTNLSQVERELLAEILIHIQANLSTVFSSQSN